jgi:hypothetical protein
MDFLVSLSTTIIYAYSVYVTFTVDRTYSLYFLSECVLLCLILFGKYLENLAKTETSGAIRRLMRLQPKTALVERDGEEMELDIDEIGEHDVVISAPASECRWTEWSSRAAAPWMNPCSRARACPWTSCRATRCSAAAEPLRQRPHIRRRLGKDSFCSR